MPVAVPVTQAVLPANSMLPILPVCEHAYTATTLELGMRDRVYLEMGRIIAEGDRMTVRNEPKVIAGSLVPTNGPSRRRGARPDRGRGPRRRMM